MSASREKKNRQEVAASGVADPKTARHAQELAKERRSNRLYAIIAIAFVVVAIGLVVWNSNIIQRGTTAVTVEGESYSAAEVSYYYHNAYNSIVNSKYASLYGINKNTALSQQSLNDTAKMMLGVSEDMTWDAYFRDAAKKSLIQLTMLKKGAAEKGMTFNDDMQKEVDSTVETFSTYAKKAGYSTSAYLKLMYGNNMTMSTFKSILKDTLLASHYQQDYIDSLTYTDEEVETYYNEHKNNFDVADYEYIYFKGTADSTKDADGNTVKPTDEENAAAKEAASANANAALEAVRNGLLMEKAADNYDNGTYTDRPTGTYSGDAVTEWVFNEERQEGDLTLIESGDNYYVVLFHSRGRNDYNTVDVRHILFKVDTSDLDSKADDYQEKLDARKAEQKEAAEAALKKWEEGARTEDSFAELANELSSDTGSNTNGGLYTEVYKGQMVTEFNDWCFDESRQPGDTGIVYNEGSYTGYHVIYFVGTDAPYWQVQVRNAMKNADYTQWNNDLVKDITATETSGMKYLA